MTSITTANSISSTVRAMAMVFTGWSRLEPPSILSGFATASTSPSHNRMRFCSPTSMATALRSSSPASAIVATPAMIPARTIRSSSTRTSCPRKHNSMPPNRAPKARQGDNGHACGSLTARPIRSLPATRFPSTAPPAQERSSSQADLDHDGDLDIASAGKLGVHVLENLKVNKVPKNVREETQPLERKWPFPGEGKEVPQEDGPTP